MEGDRGSWRSGYVCERKVERGVEARWGRVREEERGTRGITLKPAGLDELWETGPLGPAISLYYGLNALHPAWSCDLLHFITAFLVHRVCFLILNKPRLSLDCRHSRLCLREGSEVPRNRVKTVLLTRWKVQMEVCLLPKWYADSRTG